MPPATAEILERESQEFLADVELFLAEECKPSTATPIGFEVSFGRPLDDDDEPLARAEPVDIDLGGGLTFRIAGRIDRIDQVGPDAFEVLDYKTGGFWRDGLEGHVQRRPPSAARALRAGRGRTAARASTQGRRSPRGVYYFSSHSGNRERVRIPAPGRAAIATVLGDLREVIVEGAFVHAPTEDDCKFCDYAAACGERVHEQAEAKQGDAEAGGVREAGGA